VGPARYDAIERDYLKRDVVFPGGAAGVQLAGELTIPSGAAPRAGLILVTGSGPQDRDETVAGRKPFFVLSDALTRAGYAVLRYDDRGVGGSTGSYDAAMIPDFADDAAAAADMLRSALDDDGLPIGIVGHSEGGLVALQAARRTAVDFLVLLASPVAPFSDVIYDKTRSSMLAEGETPDRAEQRANALRRAIRLIGESADPEAARSDARSTLISGGLDGEMAMAYAKAFTTPHWYWVAKHIPMNDVLDFPGPIFALYAADDAGINSELMTGVIEAEALPSVEHRVLDCLNHFFQRANISGSSEYSDAGPVFDGETIPVLVEWLDRQAD
jgi:pimeloyl-ACP methyl ester carboxylesterase